MKASASGNQARLPKTTERRPLRFQVRPVLRGQLGRVLVGFAAFEVGNVAAFLLSDLASGVTGEITYVDAGFSTTSPGMAED